MFNNINIINNKTVNNPIINNKKAYPNNVLNNKTANDSLKNIKKPSTVKLDFRYFVYKPFRYKDFLNYFHNENEYNSVMENLYRKLIPYCDCYNISQLQTESKHNHYVENDKKYNYNDKVIEILEECIKQNYTTFDIRNVDKDGFFQLSTTNGLRILCYVLSNTIYILFLDPHHLIYKNQTFNKDYDNYTFFPKLTQDLKMISFNDEVLSDDCYECSVLKKFLNTK
jgi:hypothetical protein